MIKKFEICKDYRSDEACIIYYKKIIFKYMFLKQNICRRLTTEYKSIFSKMYSFRVHEVTRFLKCFSSEFTYEGLEYEKLPMFYKVLQSKHDHNGAMRATHDIHIYGYYIDSPEMVSLEKRVIKYCKDYNNSLNKEVNELYNVSVLPTSLLRRVIKIARGKIPNIDIIKLYDIGTKEFDIVMRVYRGTEHELDY